MCISTEEPSDRIVVEGKCGTGAGMGVDEAFEEDAVARLLLLKGRRGWCVLELSLDGPASMLGDHVLYAAF